MTRCQGYDDTFKGVPYGRMIQRMKELLSCSEDNAQGRGTKEAKAQMYSR